ncbi:carbon storage regulator [Clostridium sp.]|uniref:carbon storage regulator n=1 Tax=Clostridium sp. TaxID=1506 RepID=UPI00284372BD|nr:carbon storage regulator [Clostridium sp.]MDR3593988.1 carbon storage regulator [Clostridium sp.]
MRDGFINHPFLLLKIQGGRNLLVLGRKPGEYVVIGKNIIVKVIKSENGDLRLAIDAPSNIKITRGEVWKEE